MHGGNNRSYTLNKPANFKGFYLSIYDLFLKGYTLKG